MRHLIAVWCVALAWTSAGSPAASERPANGDYAIATLVEDVEALRQALGMQALGEVVSGFAWLHASAYRDSPFMDRS